MRFGRASTGGRGWGLPWGLGCGLIRLVKPRRPRLPGISGQIPGLVARRLQNCLQAQYPPGGNGGVHAVTPRPGEKDVGSAKSLDKIMGRLANVALRLLHAESVAHRTVKPRARVRQPGPGAFIQPAENDALRVDHAGFQQAKDGKPRDGVPGVADRNSLQMPADGGAGAGEIASGQARSLPTQGFDKFLKRVGLNTVPEPIAGNLFRHGNQAVQMRLE